MGLIDLVQTLTTPHPLDRYLELVRPALTVRDMRAEIVRTQRDTPGSVTLTLRPARHWAGHRAGQYVQIGVVIDGVKHTRCYSPITAQASTARPNRDRTIELTVRAHPDGLVSQYLYRHAKPGMVIDLTPAAGGFALLQPRPAQIVLISGGSGITPVLSMLRTLAAENYSGNLLFLHYAKSPEAIPHRAEIEQIGRRHPSYRIELRCPANGSGYFDADTLRDLAPWHGAAETFVCGPAALMAAVTDSYRAAGIENRLHTEEFTLTTIPVDAAQVTGATTFSASGVRADNAGTSLLEQAESAGLTPEYGCRMGICLSCTSIKRSGCTRDLRTGDLNGDPDQPIQLCVNAAIGDVDIAI